MTQWSRPRVDVMLTCWLTTICNSSSGGAHHSLMTPMGTRNTYGAHTHILGNTFTHIKIFV